MSDILPLVDGHVLCKGTDITDPRFAAVFSHNSKNILIPNNSDLKRELTVALTLFKKLLRSSVNNIGCKNTHLSGDVISRVVSGLFNKSASRSNALPVASSSLPSTWNVQKVSKLLRGLVISPLDKNTGSLCIS